MSTPSAGRLALVGVGKMGAAMAAGWLADLSQSGVSFVALSDVAPSDEARVLAEHESAALNPVPGPVDIVVVAVKPQGFREAAADIREWISEETLVISIMAGVPLDVLSDVLGVERVVRAMPNTPGALGVGVTGYVLAPACDDADRALVDRLLEPLGLVEGPLREDQMDALTAISGSGPAYVFLMTEAMSAAGRQLGLDDDMAERLARRTVSGAGVLLERSGMDVKSLRKAVTSPNGTTEAALDVLSRGLPNIVREAAEAAARRSADLSRES